MISGMHSSSKFQACSFFAPQERLSASNPRTLLSLAVAMDVSSMPFIITTEEASRLRAELGSWNASKARKALNTAIKFVRKASTYKDGRPLYSDWDISAVPDIWYLPEFVYSGKGQHGEFDFDRIVEFNWRHLLAQLPEEEFDRLFALAGGVVRVCLALTGRKGHWWMSGGADFQLVVLTRTERCVLRADYKGKLSSNFQGWGSPGNKCGRASKVGGLPETSASGRYSDLFCFCGPRIVEFT
jgi:hypothetical protein